MTKEVEKFSAAKEEAAIISDFLDWLNDEAGYALCKWENFVRHSDAEFDYTPEGWSQIRISYEQLLANYFEIDLKKLEEERQEILDRFRKEQGI